MYWRFYAGGAVINVAILTVHLDVRILKKRKNLIKTFLF